MTNVKKSVVAGLAALGVSCFMMGSFALNSVRASADWGGTNGEDSGEIVVYTGNTSKEEMTAAAATKIEELNAAITAAKEAGKDLATAYADGDILTYSTDGDGLLTAGNNSRSNWKTWDGIPLADLKHLNNGRDMWDGGIGWLSYDGLSKKVYLITAEFADRYNGDGKKMGVAVSDMFRIGDIKYQNFAGGYMKVEGGNLTEVFGKKMNADGTESPADPRGFVGIANEYIANTVNTTNAKLYKAFVDAYDYYTDPDGDPNTDDGFNVGYPFSIVKTEGELMLQHFRNGDSVRDPYGDAGRNHWAYLVYNQDMEQVFLMKDEFVTGDNGDATIKNIGAPIGDVFEANGKRYQNFEKGYAVAEGTTPQNQNATVVTGKNVDEATGGEFTLDEEGKIGRLGKAVAENLPAGVTAAELTAGFKAAYEEKVEYYEGEVLASVDLVASANGLISQTYTDNKGQKHMLVYANGNFVYLRPQVVEKMSGLGAPVGDRVKVAEAEDDDGNATTIYAYPFQNGYVKLTVSITATFVDGEYVETMGDFTIATQGATYDSEKGFFETINYAETINAERISHQTSGDDKSVDAAYWAGCWNITQPSDEAIAAAFKTAYEEAFAMGFSAGNPASAILFWVTGQSGVIKLTLKGGNGFGDFWGDNTLMTYNPEDGKAYITTGEIMNGYKTDGASGNGWATTDMMINTVTGTIVQQFKIIDPVKSEGEYTYIVVAKGGAPEKVQDAQYDFEANKNGGEWVKYLSQFGGSISTLPVNANTEYAEGARVEIDFAQFVNNTDGYYVTWNKISGSGTLDANGKYTLDAMEKEGDVVEVEVASAFDRLTFKVTLSVPAQGGDKEPDDDNPNGGEQPAKKGCGSEIGAYGALAASLALAATGAVVVAVRKKKDQ